MREIGISIYPENATVEENKNYISLASKYGFTRIFTCLLSAKNDKEKVMKEFKEIVEHANKNNMKVIADVSPDVFKDFDIDYRDLKFFSDMGLYGLRLDLGFSGLEESIMTFNEYDLKIEINMSQGTRYVDNILSYKPLKKNLIGCHNFYPHRYTGLSRKHFLECSNQFRELGIRTAAFVSSHQADFGPWKVSEGLCTLEEHRNQPIHVQAKDLFYTGLIDDVIVANAFASEEELKRISEIDRNNITFEVEIEENTPKLEKHIVLNEFHFNRGDISEYMVRSTQSRVKFKGEEFKVFNPKDIKRGDILIESSEYKRYAGELQIALKDMDNSGKTNVVGRIKEEELFLLDKLSPWEKFKFEERKGE